MTELRRRLSAWLVRGQGADQPEQGRSADSDSDHSLRWLGFVVVVGIALIIIYSLQFSPQAKALSVGSVALLAAGGCLMFGVLLGFLFGIPISAQDQPAARARTQARSQGDSTAAASIGQSSTGQRLTGTTQDFPRATNRPPGYLVNTNLQQVSDWLTKILIGVGLVELGQIVTKIQALIAYLRPAFGDSNTASPMALSLITYFAIAGFLLGYLWSRLLLPGPFRVADVERQGVEVASYSRAAIEHLAGQGAPLKTRTELV